MGIEDEDEHEHEDEQKEEDEHEEEDENWACGTWRRGAAGVDCPSQAAGIRRFEYWRLVALAF
jgi:hypothetical protein